MLAAIRHPARWQIAFIELVIGITLIVIEPTYSFDFDAYMEQVAHVFDDGIWDYSQLRGDTGWLVYPGGHVWIYGIISWLIDWRYDIHTTESPPKYQPGYERRIIRPATRIIILQLLFLAIYIGVLIMMAIIYERALMARTSGNHIQYNSTTVRCITYLLLVSRRMQSIYILGWFNDGIAIAIMIMAIITMMNNKWTYAAILFSVGVSVKMNILLFAPSFALLLYIRFGIRGTITHIGLCGVIQLLIGAPFLLVSPLSYIKRSFDLSRVFIHEYSVNWRFLPETIFVSHYWAITLLVIHIVLLYSFGRRVFKSSGGEHGVISSWWPSHHERHDHTHQPSPYYIMYVLSVANLIGVTCARSLHYQFLCWYYPTLPFLVWQTNWHTIIKLAYLIVVELCWNVHASTAISSFILTSCHITLLIALWIADKHRYHHMTPHRALP